ncbi:MAG: hypothetical protein C3F07_06065 [Anaerolineales bacterium]|nr:hypothetical protein [Anaerolineae bacterium]PWB75123.1 MAG: hypothetical protein C3F07_06065 [Anaerolineales bacterium]
MRLVSLSLLLVIAGSAFASSARGSAAPAQVPPGPDRYSVTIVDYTKYFWWMIRWGEDEVECYIEVDHEGLPTPGDIYVDCGEKMYDEWVAQKPCKEADVSLCKGFYLVLVDSQPAQKEISTKLPPPIVQVTLENCTPVYTSSTSICEYEPILVLTGMEPLADYTITGIEGLYGEQSFSCGPVCRLKLPVTGEDIFTIQFWAYSSYGDSSQVFDAKIRVARRDEGNPDQTFWYVDVLSSQWAGVPIATCVGAWGVLPPIGGPPPWLSTPTQSEILGTEVPYNYLAANLIRGGAVDATSCVDGGLLPDGSASACGMEVARPAVNAWQNQFDTIILNVAKDTGVPAHLLKNLFAIESQFWPGNSIKNDVGLGQLTEHGADTTFLWNPPFFYQFCPLVMDSRECSKGYLHLNEEQQEYARLSLISAVNATCENCPLGIDLERANFSIGVFAHTLLANCEQASQVVWNYNDRKTPDQLEISYEDMWKFTLVNYNAGGGCLATAFELAAEKKEPLTFEGISPYLEPACQGAIDYVNQVSSQ